MVIGYCTKALLQLTPVPLICFQKPDDKVVKEMYANYLNKLNVFKKLILLTERSGGRMWWMMDISA